MYNKNEQKYGRGGIRTHAIEMTGALNQRLRPLGHSTLDTKLRSKIERGRTSRQLHKKEEKYGYRNDSERGRTSRQLHKKRKNVAEVGFEPTPSK